MAWEYFYYGCKGGRALFPVDFDGQYYVIKKPKVQPLSTYCCDVIARDSVLLKKFCKLLPINIYDVLMTTALQNGYDKSVVALMMSWPYQLISLRKLCPPYLNDLRVIYDDGYRKDRLKTVVKVSTILLRSFINVVRNFSPLRLRILDLRGVPMTDQVLTREIASFSPSELHLEDYHILVDCTIVHVHSCRKFSSILNSRDSKIHVHINKLDVAWYGGNCFQNLLEHVNPNELDGLRFHSGYLTTSIDDDQTLWKFLRLTALDISCPIYLQTPLNLPLDHVIPFIFKYMPHLRRLDLSNYPLRNNLHQTLPWPGIDRLEYLNLSACRLADADLRYLSSIPLRLCELNLSGNSVLTRRLDLLRVLLRNLSKSLRVLELAYCKLENDKFSLLVKCVLPLEKLRYLNLCYHQLSWNCLREYVPVLGSMDELECVRLSYAYDESREISEQIDRCMIDKKSPPTLIKWVM